ncbi:MAG: hypothetical protein D6782_02715 [Alphaproteobacteria bacterium]|nr:MAG: hypothetical protein D6782_02715 [Alphaproteobacteria bacterium]
MIADLSAMRINGTQAPLITAAMLTSDVHNGPMRHMLPDILVEWNHTLPIETVSSPLIGEVRNTVKRTRSGDHLNRHGALFVAGQGVSPLTNAQTIQDVDLAPTIAALLGLESAHYYGSSFLAG